jgi:TonB family protein
MRLRKVLIAAVLAVFVPGAARAQSAPTADEHAAPKLTKPPKLIHFVEAPYPEAERSQNKSAAVVLRLTIDATGAVKDAQVVESAGASFDSAAAAAARQFVFEPAEIDHQPSPIRILYRYEFTLKAEAPTTATFGGTIQERGSSKPIAGVTLTLDSGQSAVTDAGGHFAIDGVTPGKHTVTLSGERLTAVRTEETFTAGKRLDATYDVELAKSGPAAASEDDLEIVVQAPALAKQVVTTEVSADQARRLPGTQGDVLKVIESMPGVARSSAGSGQLIVWGAAPDDTRVYVDGVRIPRLYHEGGLRSVVATEMVDAVELSPGGYGSSYGRGLGGLVTVRTRRADEKEFHTSIGVDVLDASVSARAPLTKDLRFVIAARRSHLHTTVEPFTDGDAKDYFPIPRYHDGQARLTYELGRGERISLTGLLSSDNISRSIPSTDPLRIRADTRTSDFYRVYARYEKELNGANVDVVPFFGIDQKSTLNRFGDIPTEASSDSTLYGARASYRGKATRELTVTVGLDAEVTNATLRRNGSIVNPAREGDVRVFGQEPLDRINADQWKVVTAGLAPFAELDVALFGEKVHITPGARFDPYFVSVNRKTPQEGETPAIGSFREDAALEPRLALRWEPTRRTVFKAAYGRYHQPAAADDLSSVFGNPTLPAARAEHFLASAGARLTKSTWLESTVFRVTSEDLAMRNPAPSPLLAEALLPIGSGRSYGAQMLLRQELVHGLFGWVSYAVVRSQRQDAPDRPYRLSDFDQSHVLTALGSWDLGRGFEVGARVRYATGFPRTPVRYAYYAARRDTYQPVFGDKNTDRIPSFFQVDLRAAKRFPLLGGEMESYLEVQNVLNRENPEEVVYSANYRDKAYITGFPILPVFGLRWTR